MSEETVRLLLNDVADGDAPVIAADPATLFARARRANRRRAAGAATATVLLILAGVGAGTVIVSQRSYDRRGHGSVASSPSPSSPSSSPSGRPGMPRPSTSASGPFCGWNDELAPTVMAGLPVNGTWGKPLQIFGICGDAAGVQFPVTEAGRTGQVAVVISRTPPDSADKEGCGVPGGTCEQVPDGYLYWNESQRSRTGRDGVVFFATARLALTSGVLVQVDCWSEAYDDRGQPLTSPPMDHAACTGQQARALALELIKTDWLE
ncbi:hypothetical protein KZZ52_53225 [Dactylosporangium sp. AC04546]|uniref:hypothetical protein n=1 Tax=Dactylosporangium sp. AC04546 TaxID=2862460 RepID=UPI001EDEB66F|nr:hypothetical protein [Dactylosporangium sp. AC04546]WVK82619.1 hypothetical protein KZZ52_53225 [Dactylosporangium sp. AC04546]